MVTPILKCNSINNPLIISTGIGDFKFSHSLDPQLSPNSTIWVSADSPIAASQF